VQGQAERSTVSRCSTYADTACRPFSFRTGRAKGSLAVVAEALAVCPPLRASAAAGAAGAVEAAGVAGDFGEGVGAGVGAGAGAALAAAASGSAASAAGTSSGAHAGAATVAGAADALSAGSDVRAALPTLLLPPTLLTLLTSSVAMTPSLSSSSSSSTREMVNGASSGGEAAVAAAAGAGLAFGARAAAPVFQLHAKAVCCGWLCFCRLDDWAFFLGTMRRAVFCCRAPLPPSLAEAGAEGSGGVAVVAVPQIAHARICGSFRNVHAAHAHFSCCPASEAETRTGVL
jgi:hypothetical protein